MILTPLTLILGAALVASLSRLRTCPQEAAVLTHTHTPDPETGWAASVPQHERYERVLDLPTEPAVRLRVIRHVPVMGHARAWDLVLHEWNLGGKS